MTHLREYTAYINEQIKMLQLPQEPAGLYEPFAYFLELGGKRIRPALTILSAELFDLPKEKVIQPALSMEIFHNFTLVHDDIMDDAPLRRNQPSVHEKWDSSTGILAGDIMLIKAYELLCDTSSETLASLLSLFNETAIEVCEGQQYDMDFESREDVTIHEYIEMIRLKTSVLLGCALKTGAILAHASKADQEALYQFGQHIGIAFQIQDDILDLYADPEKFGKQIGGDIIANKKTILQLTATSKSTAEQLEISKQLSHSDNIKFKVERTKELFDHLKVKEDCQERMNHHYRLAKEALDKVKVAKSKKKSLQELAKFLIEREL